VDRSEHRSTRPEAAGLVIHGAARYDFLVWLFTLGGERRLRERILSLAHLQPGETVLDIGCGTGTLPILAKRQVGASGAVHGVDASPEMIVRAREKARRAGADVILTEGAVQNLSLPDAEVDVVLSTLMLHHVPRAARPQIVREIKRVLKPGGRFFAVDFVKPAAGERSFIDRFHRHGFIRLDDIVAELKSAGFIVVRSGPVGEKKLQYVLATIGPAVGLATGSVEAINLAEEQGAAGHAENRHGGGLFLAVGGLLAMLALIALHGGAALSAHMVLTDLVSNPLSYVVAAALALLVVVKIGVLWFAHRFGAGLLSG
jgi:ubiquinone/menaquinone biosynthesis C-methylase UbiE